MENRKKQTPNRTFNILSRYLLIKLKTGRYFKSSNNTYHIKHYILHCSIGDWFVLYQMSRNMNRRFFAEFLTILSKRVNPCPDIECDESPFHQKEPIPGSKVMMAMAGLLDLPPVSYTHLTLPTNREV